MFYLTDNTTGYWVGIFKDVRQEGTGAWVWCGWFPDVRVERINPGDVIFTLDTTGERYRQIKVKVIRVNRVSITVQRIGDDGVTYGDNFKIEVDR